MIISASYKTDIPTFYGDWFINRVRAGHCQVLNPYSRQPFRVSLRPEDVDGVVFWTKNIVPFVRHLPEVRESFPFIVQYTINGYPRALETSVTDATRTIESAHALTERFGKRVVVWRYDTVLFSSLTPHEFHLQNFTRLAEALRGATDEVVISFAHVYRKTKTNLDVAARVADFQWWDPEPEEKKRIALELFRIARHCGMVLTVCSQPEYLSEGIAEARCVDARRFQDLLGRSVVARLKGNRKTCGCFESRDIGDYDTCPHGCVYCYAVRNRSLALSRYQRHDPASEFLFDPGKADAAKPHVAPRKRQFRLFAD